MSYNGNTGAVIVNTWGPGRPHDLLSYTHSVNHLTSNKTPSNLMAEIGIDLLSIKSTPESIP